VFSNINIITKSYLKNTQEGIHNEGKNVTKIQNSELEKHKNILKSSSHLTSTKLRCLQTFGFCADPDLSLQQNFQNALTMPRPPETFHQPINLKFHNLCKSNTLPTGTREPY
jgi:hypothetical protein